MADVRTVPKSRTNLSTTRMSCLRPSRPFRSAIGIFRNWGLRSRSKEIAPEVNGFWQNASFHNYADHGLSEEFQTALEQLIEMGRARRCAIMCAEAVWWRCHRRIIADHLLARGEQVFHLMGSDRIEPARLTPGAEVQDDETVIYPAAAGERP